MALTDSSTARLLLALADRFGADSAAIRRALDLEEQVFGRGMPALDYSVFGMLVAAVREATGRDDLGLLLAESAPIGTYGPLEFACWSAPTVGAAIELIARFTRIEPNMPDLETTVGDHECTMSIVGPPDVRGEIVEFTLAYLHLRGRQAGTPPFSAVEFAHREPRDPANYERFFECPVAFGAPCNTARFTTATWNLELTSADPITFDRLRTALDEITKHAAVRHDAVAIQRDGDWIQIGTTRIPLRRRGPLRRIVLALAALRERPAGGVLTRDQLFAIGWPGERALPEAAAQRVHTAIWELRKLGLREALIGTDDGYHLDRALPLRREE